MPTVNAPVTALGVEVGRVSDTLTEYIPGRFSEAPLKFVG
jgi:hypothetical protein